MKESKEIFHLAALKARLTAKNKFVTEWAKELNKLCTENRQFKIERDVQNAEILGLQDELKNVLPSTQ